MPWFIWMSFLTVPVMVGVACTLASNNANDPNGIITVAIAGIVWFFVAYQMKNYLRDQTPKQWVSWWLTLTVVAPLVTLFVVSLNNDPAVMSLVNARLKASEKADPNGLAASAPARRALSWSETKKLLARVHPLAIDFGAKLFTSMPAAWWFIAFGVGLWKGERTWNS
jgi:uncharacterized membrane protein YeaQ/YmgE (transglycosylase-associated protein family)